MGLLDIGNDPQSAGLLSLGLRLMSTPGKFNQALGRSGLGAMEDMQQAQRQQALMQQQQQAAMLQKMHIEQIQQQQQQDAAMRLAATQSMQAPQGLPSMMAGSGARSPEANAAMQGGINQAALPRMDWDAYQGRVDAIDPMKGLALRQMLAKDDAPMVLPEGGTLITKGGRVLAQGTQKPATTPSAIQEYQFAVGQGYKGSFEQWDTTRKRAGASSISVNMDKGFGDAFAKDAAASLGASRDKARGAANTLRTLDQIENAINTGKVVTGPAASAQTLLLQVGETIGVTGDNTEEKLANTRKLMQGAASLAVDGAAALQGQGQITEGERELVNRMAGGNIDQMTIPEIRSTVGVLRKVNTLRIQAHQEQLKKVGPEFGKFAPFYDVQLPESTVAPNVDDLVNKYRSK